MIIIFHMSRLSGITGIHFTLCDLLNSRLHSGIFLSSGLTQTLSHYFSFFFFACVAVNSDGSNCDKTNLLVILSIPVSVALSYHSKDVLLRRQFSLVSRDVSEKGQNKDTTEAIKLDLCVVCYNKTF